jgi:hypothetical protein
VTARTTIENALGALRSVSHPADVARTTHDVAGEIDRAWRKSPLVAGLDGNLVARGELVNLIVGERVLDPFRRALGSPPLRLKRGSVMRFRVRRRDGTSEEKTTPDLEPRDGDAERDERAATLRGELLEQETALATVTRSLPGIVRKRPSGWAAVLLPLYWLLGFLYRKTLGAWQAKQVAMTLTTRHLADLESFKTQRDERELAARDRYYNELRILCGGDPSGKDVREIEIEVPGIPENVELVELMGELRASADIDAALVVERDALYAPTPDGDKVKLGPAQTTIAELPDLLARARALTLARRARDKLAAARVQIEAEIDRVEQQFRERIHKLGRLALPMDKAAWSAVQLHRVKPMVVASVNAVMEHASTHMGSELAQLGATWISAVANASSGDELKAAIAMIEEQWPTSAKRIAEEVRVLVMGGAGGVARDLYVEVVSTMRAHGLPEQHLRTPKLAPEVESVALLPSLVSPTTFTLGGNWLTGLFKSFEARKTDLREKVHARVERIREVAAAEVLDAEPKLHAAVTQSLSAQLDTAIELQKSWHDQAMSEEYAAIAKEREALVPLTKSRDAITASASRLGEAAAALVAEQPAVAAAAVVAAS